MNINDFTSVDKILAEVTQRVNDKEFKKGFSKGWFIARIHDAIRELAMDTYIFKVVRDFEMPENCQIKMPEDTFNIREIYLYNGTMCNPVSSQNVYHKRLFNNMHDGSGYTAKVKDDGSNPNDIFQPNQSRRHSGRDGFYGNKFYYNTHNGVMMFSTECKAYPYVRVILNGLGGIDGELPIIPSFFRKAVVDYVEEAYYSAMKSVDIRKYRPLWQDAFNKLESYTGSWKSAIKRVSSMDTAEKESMEEYISSMYHK